MASRWKDGWLRQDGMIGETGEKKREMRGWLTKKEKSKQIKNWGK